MADRDTGPGAGPRFQIDPARLTWAFLALGVALRVGRYLADYPLWGDEAFVAVNFLKRGYGDLVRPLDFGQVCPLFFLWAERTIVLTAGFSEATLRLLPLLCAIGSLFVFRRVAGRVVDGWPLALTVALFAVSFHPIRHAAQVKPYAGDLLAACLLLLPAVEWWRDPQRPRWIWILAALTPLCLGMSHPAVFVAAGVLLCLLPGVWARRRQGALVAWAGASLAGLVAFALLAGSVMASQTRFARALQNYWANSFPPLDDPIGLVRWAAEIHSGSLFAYPGGGRNGGSTATFLLFLAGIAALIRRGQGKIVALLLAPFGFTLAAAVLRRYPYGGEARIAQYLAPSICLLAGVGLAAVLDKLPRPGARRLATAVAFLALLGVGLGLGYITAANRYRATYEDQARAWARTFWPEIRKDAEVACFYRDRGILARGPVGLTATYACNQAIYLPDGAGYSPDWDKIRGDHPLRFVLYDETRPDHPRVVREVDALSERFELRRLDEITIPFDCTFGGRKTERVWVYEFVPREVAAPAIGRVDASPVAR